MPATDDRDPKDDVTARTKAALKELAAHTVIIMALLAAFWLVENWLKLLWGPQERLLFGRVPLHWFFDVADALILVYFLGYGSYLVVMAYRGKR